MGISKQHFKDIVQFDAWRTIQDNFAKSFEFPISVIDLDGQELHTSNTVPFFHEIIKNTAEGKRFYQESGKMQVGNLQDEPQSYTTPAGLTTIAAPLIIQNTKCGALVFGPLRIGKDIPGQILLLSERIGIDKEELIDELSKLPVHDSSRIDFYKSLVKGLAVTLSSVGHDLFQTKKRTRQLEFIHQLAVSFTGAKEKIDLMKSVLHFIVSNFTLENCSIVLTDEHKRYTYRKNHEALDYVESSIVTQIINTKNKVAISDIATDFMFKNVQGIQECSYAVLAYPLIIQKSLLGIIFFYHTSHSFTNEDTEVYSLLSDRLGIALAQTLHLMKVEDKSVTDRLTGLYNKAYFMEYFKNEIARGKRNEHPTSLAIFDIDNFKRYNDTYGHPAGDEILRAVGPLLQENLRSFDTACRYGGEEFVVVMPEVSAKEALAMCERLRKLFEDYSFPVPGDGKHVTISIGLITCMNSSASPTEMVKIADEDLYKAKNKGKNQVSSSIILDKSLGVIQVETANQLYST